MRSRLAAPTILLATFAWGQANNERETALHSLVEAERAFARASVSKGMRAAFLEYLGERSVVFRPGPVDGRAWYAAQPEGKGTLNWGPIFADVSAARDMGYTTGPWVFSEDQQGKKPLRYGHYMSVWKKEDTGEWRVGIDLGISHPQPGAMTTQVSSPRPVPVPRAKSPEEEAASLLAADRAFAEASKSRGFARGFAGYAAPEVRLYRQDHAPFPTPAEVRAALETIQDSAGWSPAGSVVARSGDLGYTYGVAETFACTRVWKKQIDGAWKVVLDVQTPLSPRR